MKKKIVYTEHLLFRMKIRRIPEDLPKEIYKEAREKYSDVKTGYRIAVRRVMYQGKLREMNLVS